MVVELIFKKYINIGCKKIFFFIFIPNIENSQKYINKNVF